MKNKEKFASEIVEIAISGCSSFAVSKRTGTPEKCSKLTCENCAFNKTDKTCNELCREWAESEYKEPLSAKTITNAYFKYCRELNCSDCKYSNRRTSEECAINFVVDNYNVTEKGKDNE